VSFLKIACDFSMAYVLVVVVVVVVVFSMDDSAPRNHIVGHGITRYSKAYAVVASLSRPSLDYCNASTIEHCRPNEYVFR
jgi:hypothetical protein